MEYNEAIKIIDDFTDGKEVDKDQLINACKMLRSTRLLDKAYTKVLVEGIAELTNTKKEDVLEKYKSKIEEELTKIAQK